MLYLPAHDGMKLECIIWFVPTGKLEFSIPYIAQHRSTKGQKQGLDGCWWKVQLPERSAWETGATASSLFPMELLPHRKIIFLLMKIGCGGVFFLNT